MSGAEVEKYYRDGRHPRLRSADAPEPAKAVEGDLHALGGRGVRIHAVAPAQGVAHLLERDFAADRAVDLADRRHRFAEALAMKGLVIAACHARGAAVIGGKYAREIERAEVVVQSAIIPVVAIFLRGGVLLGGDDLPREGSLDRAVAHCDLPGVAALEMRPGAADAFGSGARALIERHVRGPAPRGGEDLGTRLGRGHRGSSPLLPVRSAKGGAPGAGGITDGASAM